MVAPYVPGAVFVDLGPDGGSYDETGHPKGCIHTTEGSSLAGAESAFKTYPPHLGYDPNTRVLHQYVRLDRCSYAFKGAESDDEFVIQVEIVGFARDTHTYSEQWYRNVGEDVIRPLRDLMGIPNNYLTFHGEGEGIVLADPNSPIRLSDASFRNFSGWVGHQHVPAPDAHWDPGRFRMDLALAYSEGTVGCVDWNTSYTFGRTGYTTQFGNWIGETNASANAALTKLDEMKGNIADLSAEVIELKALVQQVLSQGTTLVGEGEIVFRPAPAA